ncbi:MAG: hypothetical protein RMK94_09080, partial [Armatimonadota bacterium]|nr:hypothetical protein [Armatimonadota bacterium]
MLKTLKCWALLALLGAIASFAGAQTPLAIVLVRNAPKHGVVMAKVDLSQILQMRKIKSFVPENLQALSEGRHVPVQFVPDEENRPAM